MARVFEVVGDVMGDDDAPGGLLLQPKAAPQKMVYNPGVARSVQQTGVSQIMVQRPNWRDGQLAPGVMAPDEGMVPLGLTPSNGTGIFAAAGPQQITWSGQLQKPYRAERLLVSVSRAGTSATGRLLGQIFVGVDLQQATLQGIDIEVFGSPTAFGTRLTLMQAPPGVILQVPVTPTALPANADTIFAAVSFSGRVIH